MIHIRPIGSEDVDGLKTFFKETLWDTFEQEGIGHLIEFREEELQDKIAFIETVLRSRKPDRQLLVAIEDDRIVGTIGFAPCGELISTISNGRYDDLGEIGTVFVLPSMQRKGVGKKLFSAMNRWLDEHGIEEYVLDSGYARAQVYWTKTFGKPVIVAEDYWGKDAPHMIWHSRILNHSK